MATTITPSEFKNTFPEFEHVNDVLVAQLIDRGSAKLNARSWGALFDEALSYWVANQLASKEFTEDGRPSLLSPTYNEWEMGRLRLKQDAALAKMQLLEPMLRTKYGQHFCALKRQVSMGILSI